MSAGRVRTAAGALLAALLLAAGGCGGDEGGEEPAGPAAEPTTQEEPSPPSTGGPGEGGAEPEGPAVYFTEGEQLAPVPVPQKGAKLRPVVEKLLEGPPRGAGAETQIPSGVELQDIEVEGGEATVRLSRQFLKGIPPNAAKRDDAERQELSARLAQVTFTVSRVRDVEVRVVAGGRPVEVLETADFGKPAHGPRRVKRARGKAAAGTRRIQERLAQLGYLPDNAVDGLYGYRTEQAVMALQSWEGIDRDGVVGPQTRAALRTARRPRPRFSKAPRRIEVYREKGVALLIRKDRTVRAIHISTGGPGNTTPTGTYRVFRKELQSWSVPFSVWLPYASYFNEGIAFHEYPDVPPYPASHGCVRVPAPEARGVYRFARLNTVVKVY